MSAAEADDGGPRQRAGMSLLEQRGERPHPQGWIPLRGIGPQKPLTPRWSSSILGSSYLNPKEDRTWLR
jgi:hypothetical protein